MIVPAYTDVVHGKGFSINMRPGNKRYRSLIEMVKSDYDAAPKSLKGMYGNQIVNHIYNLSPPGRFLRKDDTSGIWVEVGKEEAVRKARQALRDTKPKQLVDNRAGGGDGFHRIQRTPDDGSPDDKIRRLQEENTRLKLQMERMLKEIEEMNAPSRVVPLDEAEADFDFADIDLLCWV